MFPFTQSSSEIRELDLLGIGMRFRWKNFPVSPKIAELAAKFPSKCGNKDAFDVVFLSEEKSVRGVWANIHGHPNDSEAMLFRITLQRNPPESEPPKEYVEANKISGGYPDGLAKILSELRSESAECEITGRMMWLKGKSRLRLSSRKPRGDFHPFEHQSTTFDFSSKNNPDESVSVVTNSEGAMFEIHFKMDLAASVDSFQIACDAYRDRLSPFIIPVES